MRIGTVGQRLLDSRAQGAEQAAVSGNAQKLGRLTGARLARPRGGRSRPRGGCPPQSAAAPQMRVARAMAGISGADRAGEAAPYTLQGMAGKFPVAIGGSGMGWGCPPRARRDGDGGRARVRVQGHAPKLSTEIGGHGE